mgnify:CR=1 FL=1
MHGYRGLRATALAALVLLAGCLNLPAGSGNAPAAVPQVSVTTLDDPAPEPSQDTDPARDAVAEGPAEPVPDAAPEPPPDPATLACRASGGQMLPGPLGQGRVCVRPTGDSGRACASATDCSEACLARSRTCAPFTPLLGCHEILDRAGRPLRQCIQ